MIKLILHIIDLFSRPLTAIGVDYPQFRAILEVKLMMDNRRTPVAFQQGAPGKKPPQAAFAMTLAMQALFGFFFAATTMWIPSPLVAMSLAHSFVMVMVGMTLVADFSTVLLDTTDNAVLQPRPITGRTLLAVRIAHITVYLSLLAFSLSAFTMAATAIRYHWTAPLVFAATLALSLCLIIFFASSLYLLAMRLVSAEKLRNIITWTQIIMTIAMVGGYQILPRFMGKEDIRAMSFEGATWVYFYPPAWFAAPMDLLMGHVGIMQLFLATEAVVIPLIAILVVVRVLAPSFNSSIFALEGQPTQSAPVGLARPAGSAFPTHLARWLCRDPEVRAGFDFTWRLCDRDRQFKRRVYPSIAMAAIMCGAILFKEASDTGAAAEFLQKHNFYLFILYFGSMMTASIVMQVTLTDQPEAAWIYRVLPVARPGALMLAGWKVVTARILVPTQIVFSIVLCILVGHRMILDAVIAFFANIFIAALFGLAFARHLPFSMPYSVMQQSGRVLWGCAFLILPAFLGGLHFMLQLLPYAALILIPVYAALTHVVLKSLADTDWRHVLKEK